MTRGHLPAPLAGLRVLELANYMAGPYCGMLLGDLGADVIKVENPRGGDYSRANGPFMPIDPASGDGGERQGVQHRATRGQRGQDQSEPERGEAAGFLLLNRNKRSLALDLKHPRGKALFLDLARTADVLVENFRPGTTRDLGIDYETLSATNPGLIYVAASAYGQTGPYSQRPGLDLIVQGMSGLMSITGEEGGPPVKVGVPICDLTAALYGAYAVLAALRVRDQTGEGQYVDISLYEAGVSLEVWEAGTYWATGEIPQRLGSAHRVSAPYQAVRTADGYVTIGATSPPNWARFCRALGLERLEHDPHFATNAARRARYQELAALIEEVTTTQPSEHWYRLLETAGVPCGVLQTVDQVLADPQLEARGFIHTLPHTRHGQTRALGSPARLSKTPPQLGRAGPLLGEHTAEILAELGCSDAEIAELVAGGAASTGP